jgi:hypothetical protein
LQGTGEVEILPPAPAAYDASLAAIEKLRQAPRSDEAVVSREEFMTPIKGLVALDRD